MVTELEQEGSYHCGIGPLLRAAYVRDFTMREMGKCKLKFPTFKEWYNTLDHKQRKRVDAYLRKMYHP